jgi:hypothetical protein
MKTNFQAGCSTIASSITSHGVSTASNATPTIMATNIDTACNNYYASGVSAADARVNTSSASYTSGYSNGHDSLTTNYTYSKEAADATPVSFTYNAVSTVYAIVIVAVVSSTEFDEYYRSSSITSTANANVVSYENNSGGGFAISAKYAAVKLLSGQSITGTITSYGWSKGFVYVCIVK